MPFLSFLKNVLVQSDQNLSEKKGKKQWELSGDATQEVEDGGDWLSTCDMPAVLTGVSTCSYLLSLFKERYVCPHFINEKTDLKLEDLVQDHTGRSS